MKLGPYELADKLGEGGMGAVFRARGVDGREMAVKVLRAGGARDARERFAREARLLAALSREEGFVPLLDSGESPQGPWIAMPLLGGGTLRERLASGPLGVGVAVRLVQALASAMGRAHARGIVHRDLKPENILFARRRSFEGPLIADLGLAKHFRLDATGASLTVVLSRDGVFRGTAGYMPPEQLRDARSAGPPADVFALGAVLFECLAGIPAFQGENVLELMGNVDAGRHAKLEAPGKALPPWLVALVERTLAADPARRFADAGALAEALGKKTGGARFSRRAIMVSSALIVVAVAAALGASEVLSERARRERALSAVKAAERSSELLDEDKPDEALALGEQAVELDPLLAKAFASRGAARWRKHDLDGAKADLSRAIDLEPRDASYWANRAGLHWARHEEDEVIRDANRAIALDPACAAAFMNRAMARRSKHDLAGALEDGKRAVELEPRSAEARAALSLAHLGAGSLEEAEREASRAIELDARLAFAWDLRADIRAQRGDSTGALEDYSKVIEIAPNAQTYASRSQVRRFLGDIEGAIADVSSAIAIDPSHVSAWKARGVLRLSLDELDGAISDLAHVSEVAPGDATSWSNLAAAENKASRFASAEAHASRAIELDARSPWVWENRGWSRYGLGHLDEAIADLTHSIELGSRDYMTWEIRGRALLARGDVDAAIADLTRTIELDPQWGEPRLVRAEAYTTKGEREEAIRDLEAALKLSLEPEQVRNARDRLAHLRAEGR